MGGHVSLLLVGGLTVYVLTGLLTVEEYGLLGGYVTVFTAYTQIVKGPFNSSIVRNFDWAAKLYGYQRTVLMTLNMNLAAECLLVVVLLSGVLIVDYWDLIIGDGLGWAFALFYAVFGGRLGSLNSMMLASGDQYRLVFSQVLNPILRLLIAVFMLNLSDAGATTVVVAFTISVAIQYLLFASLKIWGGLQIRAFFVKTATRIEKEYYQAVMSYSFKCAGFGVFTAIYFALDRWLIAFHHGFEDLAIYLVIYQIGFVPWNQLSVVFSQIFMPKVFQFAGNGNLDSRLVLLYRYSIFVLFLGLFFAALGAVCMYYVQFFFVTYFFSDQYVFQEYDFALMAGAGIVFGTVQAAALAPVSESNIKDFSRLKIFSSTIGILALVVLIPIYGYFGAIISQVVHSLAYAAGLYRLNAGEIYKKA